jgi:plastocyanin
MLKFAAVVAAGLMIGAGGAAVAHAVQLAAAAPNLVGIDNFAFGPGSLTVKAGATVTWTNHDDEVHTVVSTANPGVFKSGALDTDDTFSFTFDKPGTYQYFCSIHPRMTGTIVVN